MSAHRFPKMAIHAVRSAVPHNQYKQTAVKEIFSQLMEKLGYQGSEIDQWTQKVFSNPSVETRHMHFDPKYNLDFETFNPWEMEAKAIEKSKRLMHTASNKVLEACNMRPTDIDAFYLESDMSFMAMDFMHHGGVHNLDMETNYISSKGCVGFPENLCAVRKHLAVNPHHAVQTMNVDAYSVHNTYTYGNVLKKFGQDYQANKKKLRSMIIPSVILGDAALSTVILGEKHPDYEHSVYAQGSMVVCDMAQTLAYDGNGHAQISYCDFGRVPHISDKVPEIGGAAMTQAITNLLSRHPDKKISFWALHPGGARVLEQVQKKMNLSPEQLRFSYEVLKNYGNCASPTVGLVLELAIQKLPKATETEYGVLAAIGPGMLAKAILLERHKPLH